MSEVLVLPGFKKNADKVYCSSACALADGEDPDDAESNLFPLDQDRYETQKSVMEWQDTCTTCNKALF
jgi:hypothetical protein